ncbi:MAG: hypothetical protein NTV75_04555 [Bacteroidia bacterium]|nr:hypothetical protein [Bacteroidia bacterium]
MLQCKKEPIKTIPVVSASGTSGITSSSVTIGGELISDGGALITVAGVCWSTSLNPTIANTSASIVLTKGTFTLIIQNLNPGISYHLKVFATNAI